jgi:hypothetical protein
MGAMTNRTAQLAVSALGVAALVGCTRTVSVYVTPPTTVTSTTVLSQADVLEHTACQLLHDTLNRVPGDHSMFSRDAFNASQMDARYLPLWAAFQNLDGNAEAVACFNATGIDVRYVLPTTTTLYYENPQSPANPANPYGNGVVSVPGSPTTYIACGMPGADPTCAN